MDEEAKVLSTRQIGFELKAANNMIRRKMDSIFAQQDGSELIGMQRPLLGYLYHKSRHGDVYQKDVEKEFRIRRSTATVMLQSMEQKGYVVPCGFHGRRQIEENSADGKSNRTSSCH